jgi:hypothetical protein
MPYHVPTKHIKKWPQPIIFFFYVERRIILYDSWVHQHVTSTVDYKIVPML